MPKLTKANMKCGMNPDNEAMLGTHEQGNLCKVETKEKTQWEKPLSKKR